MHFVCAVCECVCVQCVCGVCECVCVCAVCVRVCVCCVCVIYVGMHDICEYLRVQRITRLHDWVMFTLKLLLSTMK